MNKFKLSQIKRENTVWRKSKPWIQTYTFLLLEAIFIFFIVSLLLFFLIDQIYESEGRSDFRQSRSGNQALSDERFLQIEAEFDLQGSYIDRYLIFLKQFWDGSLRSFRVNPNPDVTVGDIVGEPFLTSFKLGILGLIIGVSIGLVVGLLAGRKPGGLLDKLVSSYVIVVLSLPVFVTGIFLQWLSYETGNFELIYEEKNVATWILPMFNIAIPIIAVYARFLRTTVQEELSGNYVNLARSKGVSSTGVAFKHVLKPSLYPLVTNLPFAVIFAFSGAIVTESVFAIDGAGTTFLRAIAETDTWLLMYITMIYTLISLVAFVIRDLSYPLIDPQAKVNVGLFKRKES